jgi:6-phosphofructo-2-kinase/fructose-2,6-biphosphatase 2
MLPVRLRPLTSAKAGIETMFVESVCNDRDLIVTNVREFKLRSPDYLGIGTRPPARCACGKADGRADPEEAVRDFLLRIAHYEKAYESVLEDDIAYLRYIDVGRQVVMNRIKSYLPSRICYFITHLHTKPRPIYFV